MKTTRERGAATAEYTVGSLGAVFIAWWIYRIGAGSGPDSVMYRLVHNIMDRIVGADSIFGGDWAWRWFM